jgi:MtN3 and saliva related transmembrane protein
MESELAIAAATWAIAMALGPLLQVRKIVRHQSARSISIGYFVVLLIGFLLWLAYGIAAENYALIIPNAVAAVVIAVTIAVTLRYRGHEARVAEPHSDPGPV